MKKFEKLFDIMHTGIQMKDVSKLTDARRTSRERNFLCLILTGAAFVLISALCLTVHAEEETQDTNKTGAPYFYVETQDPSLDCFPLKETSVTVDINGMIADIHVLQTYANTGTAPLNASYVFPASDKVTVHGMQMRIGNQLVTAQIKEKEEAKEEFEEAKEEGKSASLLEEERPNVFSMNIANIMPQDVVSIDLHYTELITPAEGTYSFVYPTVVGPRYVSPILDESGVREEWTDTPYLHEGTLPKDKYDIHVSISAAVPITELTSSSHQINVAWENEAKAAVSLADASDYAGNRDFILDYKLTGEEISTGLLLNKGENENFFMLMVQPPNRIETTDIPAREYIFVLDISGSMYGYPLDTAKKLIGNLVTDLRETDVFNLILFSDEAYRLSDTSLPATEANVKRAIRMIDTQEGGGGTELLPALEKAVAIPAKENVSRGVVVITDGYVFDEADIFRLIGENAGTSDFFSFGIGSSVNRYLINGIARTGQGEPFVVTNEKDADETARQFQTYIQSPVMTDIDVTFEGFDAYDVEPAILPTLYAQKPIVLLGKWRGEPAGSVRITGKTGSGDYDQTVSVAEILQDTQKADSEAAAQVQALSAVTLESDALSYLWAQKKVERLTDYGMTNDNPDVKDEVTQLGLTYNMLTPYTSFIAVVETIRNPEGSAVDTDQPLPLPLGVSDFALGGYMMGSEPGEAFLAVMVLGLAGWQILRTGKRKRKLS